MDRAAEDEETFAALDVAFDAACAPWREGIAPLELLFSGGVDSGLLAFELRQRPELTLVTIGRPESHDLLAAEAAARTLGLPCRGETVTVDEIRALERELTETLPALPRTARSVLASLGLALARCRAATVLCGQGADELFLGYAHFRHEGPATAETRADDDLRALLSRDWPAARALARASGRELVAPYLDPGFVRVARSIPIARRLPDPDPKALFRRWAMRRGLPESIALRPKKAMQFGSGIDRWIRRDARGPGGATTAK